MTDTDLHNHQNILNAISNGDLNAFTMLYDHYKHKVYFTAVRTLKSTTEAEDALQEIFLKVWVHRDKLAQMDYFPTWLNTITRNHLYNLLKQKAHQANYVASIAHHLTEPDFDKTYSNAEFKALAGAVQTALEQLTPQQRKVFELSRTEGLKHRDIADQLQISVETVKKHMMEALRKIKLVLKERGLSITTIMFLQLLQ